MASVALAVSERVIDASCTFDAKYFLENLGKHCYGETDMEFHSFGHTIGILSSCMLIIVT